MVQFLPSAFLIVPPFVLVLLICFVHTGVTELYSAQVDIDNLFVLEKLVAKQIQEYVLHEEARVQEIRKRFESGFGHLKNVGGGNAIGDPIRNFVVVRRLINDLNTILDIAGDETNHNALRDGIERLRNSYKFPTREDLLGTAQALIRAQETYKLNTAELASGYVAGFYCGSPLNVDDCFELGKQSYGSQEFGQSINWLSEALKRSLSSESPGHDGLNLQGAFTNDLNTPLTGSYQQAATAITKEILQYLEWAQNINKTLRMAKEFIGGDTFDGLIDEVSKMYETVEGNPKVEESFRNVKLKYEALCRKEIYNSNLFVMPNASTREHKCYFHYGGGHPYYQMGPMKEEVLSTSPLVLIFHDVVLDGEIAILKDLATPMFKRSGVITSSGGTKISNVRTGKVAWLEDDAHPVIAKINRRITALTHFELSTSEELQIVNYGSGGQYEPHFDFYYGSHEKAINDDNGNRITTLLIYMSDVIAGGATVFPSLNLSVQPRKGAGLFWYNLLEDGTGDFRTRHGACPVLIGSKWVANKWIHERCNSRTFQYESESEAH